MRGLLSARRRDPCNTRDISESVDDLRAGGYVGVIREPGSLTRAVLNGDLEPAAGELRYDLRDERDAALSRSRLTGHRDTHREGS